MSGEIKAAAVSLKSRAVSKMGESFKQLVHRTISQVRSWPLHILQPPSQEWAMENQRIFTAKTPSFYWSFQKT
jgi:hypothetical protein